MTAKLEFAALFGIGMVSLIQGLASVLIG